MIDPDSPYKNSIALQENDANSQSTKKRVLASVKIFLVMVSPGVWRKTGNDQIGFTLRFLFFYAHKCREGILKTGFKKENRAMMIAWKESVDPNHRISGELSWR